MAVYQSGFISPDPPPSRASSAPTGVCGWSGKSCSTHNPVGVSLLAIAVSQPTLSRLIHRFREQAQLLQGLVSVRGFVFTAGAGICGGSGNLCPPQVQGFCGGQRIGVQPTPLWEPSLLAIAICQPIFKLTATPPSQANSAPTAVCVLYSTEAVAGTFGWRYRSSSTWSNTEDAPNGALSLRMATTAQVLPLTSRL